MIDANILAFNKELRNLALNFNRHDVDKFASELTFKDFVGWVLHLRSEGGATLQDRIYHTLEPKLADILSTMCISSSRFKDLGRNNFLTGYRLNPVGYDSVDADKQEAINKIIARRWKTVMVSIAYEKTDPERAARRYQHMEPWFKVAYDKFKLTKDESVINDLPINL